MSREEMISTDINAPTPPDDTKAAPIAVAAPQEAISAATVVSANPTPEIATTPPVQDAPAPRVAGGNLVMQGTEGRPAPAVPLQQSQSAPQVITPVSTLKTS